MSSRIQTVIALAGLALLLAACETGPTLAERCVGYQGSLALADVLYEDLVLRDVDEARKVRAQNRIDALQATVDEVCSPEALAAAAAAGN